MALTFAVALVVTAALTPLAARAARRLGVVDHPGPLKVQTSPVPYLGGVAVAAGLAAGPAAHRPALLLPLGLALGLGLADDVAELGPAVRLAGAGAIGVVVAALSPTGLPEPLGVAAVALATVLLVNAVNLIDGLDGLAAGVVLTSAAGFAALLDRGGAAHAAALGGAALAFLAFNRPPARIYLGDAGSYLLGTSLAVLLADAWQRGRPVALSVGALALVAYPVAEVAFTVVRRARSRSPLSAGDRDHAYDQLVARGWRPGRASLAAAALQAALVAVGLAASTLTAAGAVALVASATAVVTAGAAAAGFLSSPAAAGRA